jgi:hypothetical protein
LARGPVPRAIFFKVFKLKAIVFGAVCVALFSGLALILLILPIPYIPVQPLANSNAVRQDAYNPELNFRSTSNSEIISPKHASTHAVSASPQFVRRQNKSQIGDISSSKSSSSMPAANDHEMRVAATMQKAKKPPLVLGLASIKPNNPIEPAHRSTLLPNSTSQNPVINELTEEVVEEAEMPLALELRKAYAQSSPPPDMSPALAIADAAFAEEVAKSGISNSQNPEYFAVWQRAARRSDDILRGWLGWDRFNTLSVEAKNSALASLSKLEAP